MRAEWMILLLLVTSAVNADDSILKVSADERKALRIETRTIGTLPPFKVDVIDGLVTMPAAARQAVVSPFAGVVQQTFVAAGDVVAAGQPLVRILSRELLDAEAAARESGAELAAARQAADRDRQLLAEGIIAAARAEQSRSRLQQAEAQAARSTALLRSVHPGESPGEFVLRAPGAGRVGVVHGEVGDPVAAMSVVALLDSGDGRWVDAQVPLALQALIRTGDTVRILPGNIEGRVLAMGTSVQPGTQAAGLRASTTSPALVPGAAVRIEVQPAIPAGSFAVPAGALSRDAAGTRIFVAQQDGFLPVTVVVLGEAGEQVVVRADINADAKIAVRGVSALAAMLAGAK